MAVVVTSNFASHAWTRELRFESPARRQAQVLAERGIRNWQPAAVLAPLGRGCQKAAETFRVMHAPDLAAGLAAGAVSRTATAPLERIKTEFQLACTQAPPSMRSVARGVYRDGGGRAFFQGNLTNVLKVAPQTAVFFMATDAAKKSLPTRHDPSQAKMHSFLVGVLAGATSQLFVYPLEPIKTRLTVAPKGQYKGIFDCGWQIVRSGGPKSLFVGLGPTMLGVVPYAGTQRLFYDLLQRSFEDSWGKQAAAAPAASFCFGLLSSSIGMAVSYPFMLVRTRLHMESCDAGSIDCLKRTLAREGVRGLFKGLLPNLAKNAPAAAASFAIYDAAKEAICGLREK